MPGTYEYRRVVLQDYYNSSSSSSNRQPTSYHERTAVVSSFLAVQPHVPWTSPLFSPACEFSHVLATRLMNHEACNVESRSLNCWNSVSTAQLFELTAQVFDNIATYESRSLNCWNSVSTTQLVELTAQVFDNVAKNEYSTPCQPAAWTQCKHAKGILRHSRGRGARSGRSGPGDDPGRGMILIAS